MYLFIHILYYYERKKFNLTINPNGGIYKESSDSFTTSEYYQRELTIENPIKVGYNFTGWTKSGEGTINGNILTIGLGSTTLTANYQAQEYGITYNYNGGSGSLLGNSVIYDDVYGELPTATRVGYQFNGWYT
ncbi:MAG: InlB B-repeat-containing protein, partial [Clostridia bacterium]|nr:InlB B-repeat-containing protein [Clostridia bacterium]